MFEIKGDTIPTLWGKVILESSLELNELATLVGNTLFSGLEFSGLEDEICEEIPAVYLKENILGLKVSLYGSPSLTYCLSVQGVFHTESIRNERVYLDGYLFELCKNKFAKHEIVVVSSKRYGEERYPA